MCTLYSGARGRQPLRAPRFAAAGLMALAAVLAGCATPPPAKKPVEDYPAPADGAPSARVLVRAALPVGHGFLMVRRPDNDQCKGAQLMLKGKHGEQPKPLRIRPGELHTVDFAVTFPGTKRGCVNRWSFTPQAGHTYLIRSAVSGTQCPARLFDATRADKPVTPPDLVSRVSKGNKCVPLADAPKVSPGLLEGGQDANGEAVLAPRATEAPLKALIEAATGRRVNAPESVEPTTEADDLNDKPSDEGKP